MAKKVLIINGPNLNLLGTREPQRYGDDTLPDIERQLAEQARKAGAVIEAFQSNDEGKIVERVQRASEQGFDFIVINPAAYTHTSVALRDAFAAVRTPFVEVHLSNVHARESFRRQSYLSELAVGVVSGLGAKGYELALRFALDYKA